MSKIGKRPVTVPPGVTVKITAEAVFVEGPRGKLSYAYGPNVQYKQEGGTVTVSLVAKNQQARIDFGTARSHLVNMLAGVTSGWKRTLELNGVGYTAQMAGDKLELLVGLSHEVKFAIPEGVSCKVNRNVIELESNDKQQVGELAASIRRVRPPEPYLGKGIKYAEEKIRRKAGKAAA